MLKLPLLFSTLLLALASPIIAQDDAPPPVTEMKEVSPGIFEIGKLLLDQKARSVSIPGQLNMADGNLEYLLVTEQGSTHESLLVTQIAPTELHFAMLLLGAKGSGMKSAKDMPPPQINSDYLKSAPKLAGERVSITVKWKVGEAEKSAPAEDWIRNTETKKAMERGPWTYNGSLFNDGHFLAQVEGAHAALVTYPAALINNPRKGSDNDQIWMVNEKAVPPAKTPLTITIQLLDPAPATPTPPVP